MAAIVRRLRIIGILILLAAAAFAYAKPADASYRPETTAGAAGAAHTISGVDLHDGTVVEDHGVYYLYGTEYGCGFQWGNPNTHWCGFGVSAAPSLDGPWSPITTLVAPTDIDTWNGMTWDQACSRGGAGCFNPRMVQRNDGVWILAFNSPADYNATHANAYYMMGCEGPAGPCGPGKGPHGTLRKPPLWVCHDNGDYSIVWQGADAWIVCTMANQTLNIEKLDAWWTSGTGQGVVGAAGFDASEGPGLYYDTGTAQWVMTLNYRNCGYGNGCGLAYATAPNPLGPWSSPRTSGATFDVHSRAVISANSCGGQPRTVTVLDGVAYQVIDEWSGSPNETGAPTLLTPLTVDSLTTARPWHPFKDLACR